MNTATVFTLRFKWQGKQVEIEFYFTDQYRAMEDCNGILAMDEGFRQEAPQNAGETALPEIGSGFKGK